MKCKAFEHGVWIGPLGQLAPCCRWQGTADSHTEDYRTQFRKYQTQLDHGWITACEDCRLDEQDNVVSLRQIFNQTFKNRQGLKLDLKISNLCNLACRMCGPDHSSRWGNLMYKTPSNDWLVPAPNPITLEIGQSVTEHILDLLPSVTILKFTGGEPTMIPQVKTILQHCVDTNISSQIDLHLTTNLNHRLDHWWQDMFTRFRKVNLSCSIDGIQSRYEYIRGFSDWGRVVSNINILKALTNSHLISFYVTSMWFMLTAGQRSAIEHFWHNQHISLGWSPLYDPSYMGFGAMTPELRQKLSVFSRIPYSLELWQTLITQMDLHDRAHGTDFRSECPELFV